MISSTGLSHALHHLLRKFKAVMIPFPSLGLGVGVSGLLKLIRKKSIKNMEESLQSSAPENTNTI